MEKYVSSARINPYYVTIVVALVLIMAVPFFGRGEFQNDSTPYPQELYAMCFDGIDNDGDGFSDLNDPDCPRCFDGIDNDQDGLVDENDPDCHNDVNLDSLASNDQEDGFGGNIDAGFQSDTDISGGISGSAGFGPADASNNGFGGTQSFGSGNGFGGNSNRGTGDESFRQNNQLNRPIGVNAAGAYSSRGVYTTYGYIRTR
jgi:hypothetical protein